MVGSDSPSEEAMGGGVGWGGGVSGRVVVV